MEHTISWQLDDDLPDGFDPDDLDADMFEDFPDRDPAKDILADDEE
jgi:hypothetical protein